MYVVNEIQSAMRNVVDAVQNRDTEEEIPETEESGYFVSRIDQVRIVRIIALMYPYIQRAVGNNIYYGTVKPVLSRHSKIAETKVLMANGNLMKVKSIAECSPWSILQCF